MESVGESSPNNLKDPTLKQVIKVLKDLHKFPWGSRECIFPEELNLAYSTTAPGCMADSLRESRAPTGTTRSPRVRL